MKKRRQDASPVSSDRQKWQKVFDPLVGMITKQQSQLHTLVRERSLLEDRIRTQQKRYDSDVAFLRERISQMKRAMAVQDMMRSLDAMKLELAVGLKQREALLRKMKLDEAELELADFKECLNVLCPSANPRDDSERHTPETSRSKGSSQKSSGRSAKELDVRDHLLEDEIKRLKQEYDVLVLDKNAEISALLTEKKFVWNQYKILETNLNDKLKSKEAEIRLANEKVSGLLASMEKLQSSNDAKDEVIAKLESKIADKEALARKRGDELVRLAHELELLRRARCTSETPVLSRCTTSGSITSSLGNKKGTRVSVNKPPSAAQGSDSTKNSERGGRGSKRKADEIDSSQVTPKLFSSSFKIPKLKTPVKQMR
ncbi:uncharacterized protein LOC116189370 [Punica granatum]|uniref:Uncharacterized protein LOC116189370 n=1 Tax=Punica granatum TaxID=22663 RepID=A0A6P8BZ52_PUNGR|nr:uncharacterized protein LOC116189370 [Punica granatum]